MFTRKLATPGFSAIALFLGIFGQEALADEELIVYGDDVVARLEAQQALFRSEMDEYVRSVSESIKATLDGDLKHLMAPKVEVAGLEGSIRG